MTKAENIINPTEEQIKQWKEQHGAVYELIVAEDPENFETNTMQAELDEVPTLKAWIKKPDRILLNMAIVMMSRNLVDAGKAIVKNCWLGGDPKILDLAGPYLTPAALQAVDLIDIYRTKLKKL